MKGKGIASSRRACPGGKGEGRVRPSMVSRREVIVKSADEYRKASKKDEDQILYRITEITGYNWDYASHLLTLFGKRI
jgi:hypothetical protein